MSNFDLGSEVCDINLMLFLASSCMANENNLSIGLSDIYELRLFGGLL